jgi:DivIVA domain-containing protein
MSNALFATVSMVKVGYDRENVERFFDNARRAYEGGSGTSMTAAEIQQTSFDLVRGGYNTREVDAALDRLEAAFAARERAEFINTHGQDAWMSALATRAQTLYGRLGRPSGQRFAPPDRGKQGYAKAGVDTLCDRLVGYFDRHEPLTSTQLREVTFPRASGDSAYAEGPVDAFIARAIEVLLGVE